MDDPIPPSTQPPVNGTGHGRGDLVSLPDDLVSSIVPALPPLSTRLLRRTVLVVVPLLIVALFFVHRWEQMGEFPSGLDGGNWLAIGRNMTGQDVHAPNGGVYPPLVPITLYALSLVVTPYFAAKCIAICSALAVSVSVFVVSRSELRWWAALLVGFAVAFARPITEPMAFGGYPQNLAVAACVLTTWYLARLLLEPRRSYLLWATAFALLAGLSHHMFFIFTVGAAATLALLWLVLERPRLGEAFQGLKWFAIPLAAGLTAFVPTYAWLVAAGYSPPINPASSSLAHSIEYGFRGAEPVWLALWGLAAAFVVARLALGFAGRKGGASPLFLAAAAMFLPASIGFAFTGEARLLPGVAIAVPLLVALLAVELHRRARNVAVTAVLAAAPASLLVLLLPTFERVIEDDLAFYTMLDQQYVEAVEWSDAHRAEGAVAVAADRRDWPVGWWWRGLSGDRVFVGSNARWLAFEQEREEARIVARLLRQRSAGAAAQFAQEHGIGRLVVYREEWISWRTWIREPGTPVRLAFANDTFAVLDFDRSPGD